MQRMKIMTVIAVLVLLACNNKAEKAGAGGDSTVPAGETKIEEKVPDRSLAGRWKPVYVDVPSMSEEEKKNLIDHAVIEFTGSGGISTTLKETKREGTYMFSEQDSKLHTKLGEKEEKFDISWDGDLLKMRNDEGTVTLRRIP
jgi:hypothetical protein